MDLLDKIFEAGIVGCGGAGFPSHVKFKAKVDNLIINAAECEPLLRTDRFIMKNRADEIIEAVETLADFTGAENTVIALKSGYKKEIASLETAILARASKVRLHKMESFYPAGDEQVIVHEVTGRIVPPAGIPLDVGCVVSNIATMLAVSESMHGKPFTEKYLTVTGCVNNPTVLKVPVGTSFRECIEKAGGINIGEYSIISGGPMMGKYFPSSEIDNLYVTKTTSGILIVPEDINAVKSKKMPLKQMLNRAKASCIQCQQCSQLCPRHMLGHPVEPHKIMRKLAMAESYEAILDDKDALNALYCCECGVCEIVACPMGLMPRTVNSTLKKMYAERGIRAVKGTEEYKADENREYRKVPTKRAASRAGVGEFNSYTIENIIEFTPRKVKIALRQSIGAPPELLVSTGQFVNAGEKIAKCPDGKLGANLHASISGKVTVEDDSIIIEGGEL